MTDFMKFIGYALLLLFATHGIGNFAWRTFLLYSVHKGWSAKCETCRGFGYYLVTLKKEGNSK